MGQDEDRRMERRVGTPPAPPVGVVVPSGEPVLAGPHDLGADAGVVLADQGVVDPAGAAGLAAPLPPPASLEHPFVQPLVRMAERAIADQAFAGARAEEDTAEPQQLMR